MYKEGGIIKDEGATYPDALLPHEAYQLCHAKEEEISCKWVLKMFAEHEADHQSRHKRGEPSGAAQGQVSPHAPTSDGKVFMGFPDFHASAELC